MWMTILINILSSKMVIDLIAKGVTYLVEHKTSGIGRDLSMVLIEAISKSKHNSFKKTESTSKNRSGIKYGLIEK